MLRGGSRIWPSWEGSMHGREWREAVSLSLSHTQHMRVRTHTHTHTHELELGGKYARKGVV